MSVQQSTTSEGAKLARDFERLFNATPAPYLILAPNAPDFTIIAVNEAYLAATRTRREQIVGFGLFEVFPNNPNDPHADGVANLRASLMRVLENRAPDLMRIQKYDIPLETFSKEFDERYWSPLNTPVFDDSGNIVQIIHQVQDVSEKVRESQILMQLSMEHAAIGTWLYDRTRGVVTSSEEVKRMFGMADGDEHMFSRVHPTDRPRVEREFTDALDEGKTYDSEFRIVAKDGVRWIRSKGRVLDRKIAPVRLVGFAEDITERKLAEEALAVSQSELETQWAELETIYRTAPIGLALFDPVEFRYLRLNNRQAEIVGLPPEEILGKTLTEIAPIEGLREMFEKVARGEPLRNALLEGELPMRPGEHRYWTVNYEPVFGPDGKVQAITAASLEITAQKRAERALVQSEKLAAVGRLAASIAHEINNPLESVTNLLFLAQHTNELDTVRSYIKMADSELARVTQIATQTLRFHRQNSVPTPTRLYEVLDNVLALYQGRITNAGIEVTKQYRQTPPVTCYADELRQVFANLVSNALDAAANGGRIVVRKRERTDWRTGKRGVLVTIADSGHGMSPETRKRIFEPFYTTKESTGTGLGLWVSQGIVEKHGGSIKVRSNRDEEYRGTSFSVFVPYDNPTKTAVRTA